MPRVQLPLAVGLRDSTTYANFLPGANAACCHAMQQAEHQFIYLWGPHGSGKSHLLQAACHAEDQRGGRASYLPLGELLSYPIELLDGMEAMDVLCIDDLDLLVGNLPWQQALFHLYNRLRDSGKRLFVAGNSAPSVMGLELPDLVSRLGWGLVYQLHELNDEGKAEALRLRARQRGMSMPVEVANYLLVHGPRDMHRLFALLDQMDERSLVEQRRLTIPFVRQIL